MTPNLPVMLAGYADRDRPADSVRDPLLAAAVSIGSDAGRVVIVSIDCLGLDVTVAAPLRARVAKIAGTSADLVHLCASHTHFGPILSRSRSYDPRLAVQPPEEDALRILVGAVSQAVENAIADERESSLETLTLRAAGFAFNRRFAAGADATETHFLFPEDAGDRLSERPIDERVTVLRFRRGNRFVATLVNLACHPVCGADDARYAVSADWVHAMRSTLSAEFGCPTLFLQGAAGDVVPMARLGRSRELVGHGYASVILLNRRRFRAVANPVARCATRHLTFPVVSMYDGTDLDADFDAARQEILASAADWRDGSAPGVARYRSLLAARLFRDLCPDGTLGFSVSGVGLGPLVFVFLPFEILTSFGTALAERYPEARIVSCADGYDGYLPDRTEIAAGGYEGEAGSRHLAVDARDAVLEAASGVVESLVL
ncbi:MAG: hypothetical protein EA382_01845 [Spirochaetaceae bacterium]|nr:MAG: hypothetical protein EA382_01845 [Spirochaetaceae bacterium]